MCATGGDRDAAQFARLVVSMRGGMIERCAVAAE
jgi:hypothetical protein